jgi:uncharacterized protein YjbI with pentapeptide repeats
VRALRKVASTIFALALLAVAADAEIFHRPDIANYLQAAVAIIPPRFSELLIALLSGLALLGILIILRRLASSVAASIRYLWGPRQSYGGWLKHKERFDLENDLRANRIQVITTVVQALGGIAVIIGIYFAWANLKNTQEAQRDTQTSQEETIRITNEGQITDRFTKAIDQLGSPQLELRLGGIYALERIARDSEKDHRPIMEVLTTFVRVHAPIEKTSDQPSNPHGTNPPSSRKPNSPGAEPAAAPSPDVQAILTVIGRRDLSFEKGRNDWLVLTRTNLVGAYLEVADLDGAHLEGAELRSANLEGAHLNGAYLEGADLSGADLSGAQLNNADLTGANLSGAQLPSSDLGRAVLDSAHLSGAYLWHADLSGAHINDADLSGANLMGAHLSNAGLGNTDLNGASLKDADVSGAVLESAQLKGAYLKDSIGLAQSQVDSALGDKDTVLPQGIVMPESWKHPKAE